jgi:HSP20 family molecular chaperone IbpA
VDVFEDGSEIIVVVALPGVAADAVEVTMEPGAMLVRAEARFPFAEPHHIVRRLEIPYGHFERRIPLPFGGLEPGTRESSNGCLVLRLRKPSGGAKS